MEMKIRKGMAALVVLSMLLMMLSVNVFAATTNVTVGAQTGSITATREAQSATFAVTTDAADAAAVTIAWFEEDGITSAAVPTGLTVIGTNVASSASTITINAGDTSVAGSYYFKATIDSITSDNVTVTVAAPIQLTIAGTTMTLTKEYDGNTAVEATTIGALSGVIGSDVVTVSAVSVYDTNAAGIDKTITVVYTLAGIDSMKYIKPVDYVVSTGVITKLQLTIADPVLTLAKVYDGETIAAVTAAALSGVIATDTVTVSAAAAYDTELVGTDKTITVVYTLAGADEANYIKPADFVVATGVITANKTALTAAITAEVGAVHASPVYVLTETDYTAASWTAYTDAIAAAIVVEADVNATQIEIDVATAAIATSKTGLVRAYTLAIGVEGAGGAGYTRTITIGGADVGNLAGKYLVVQFTQGTGINAKVSIVMISPANPIVTVSYVEPGTMVKAWLTSGMPDLVALNMGVTVYATITTH